MAEMSKLESASGCLPAARSVPNMKYPRRNGGEGNFYKWLPGPRGRWFVLRAAFQTLSRVVELVERPSTPPGYERVCRHTF